MLSTNAGKSILFVQKLHAEMEKFQLTHGKTQLEILAPEFIIVLVERFLDTQEKFIQEGKPYCVDVGYHYTNESSLDSILMDGLLTKLELLEHGIRTERNGGSCFGHGIYTGQNATAFLKFGDVGLLVARLKGRAVRLLFDGHHRELTCDYYDTLIGNKKSKQPPHYNDETILRQSSQALPLIQYPRVMAKSHLGQVQIIECQTLVSKLLDEFFNTPFASLNNKVRSGLSTMPPIKAYKSVTLCTYSAPVTQIYSWLDLCSNIERCTICTPSICPICLEPLKMAHLDKFLPFHKLKTCGHVFHFGCLEQAINHGHTVCAVCKERFVEPTGYSPSGYMTIARTNRVSSDGNSIIAITYKLRGGVQAEYHKSPGSKYSGTQYVAYIPDSQEGRDLLLRLKCAFRRGLVFSIGPASGTSKTNSVTWTTIPHKTSFPGESDDFPDPSYFVDVNRELDRLWIPKSLDLEDSNGSLAKIFD
jgi:Deltex C-terminal domain/Ring finger domain